MAKVPSSMLPIGTLAPNFLLTDTISDKQFNLDKLSGKVATVVCFICNHCPYVKHVIAELPRLANDYESKGVGFIAINSNDITKYPDDSPENMRKFAEENALSFPYLFDETQEVALAYQAKCTPDFYVFDSKNQLVYRGQLDDSRLGNNIRVSGNSIRSALNNLIEGKLISEDQRPSLGCSIKWKD
ncbi:MAG: thioredoxin family protein [Legionellaceae bacterium]|nr:thioredoxin family protein [Legionellaceae bacterium]